MNWDMLSQICAVHMKEKEDIIKKSPNHMFALQFCRESFRLPVVAREDLNEAKGAVGH